MQGLKNFLLQRASTAAIDHGLRAAFIMAAFNARPTGRVSIRHLQAFRQSDYFG